MSDVPPNFTVQTCFYYQNNRRHVKQNLLFNVYIQSPSTSPPQKKIGVAYKKTKIAELILWSKFYNPKSQVKNQQWIVKAA